MIFGVFPAWTQWRCSHLKPWGILGSRALFHDRSDTQTKTTCFLPMRMRLGLESLFQRNPHKPFITQALLMQKVELVVTPLIVPLFYFALSTHGLQNILASGFPSAPLADSSQVYWRTLGPALYFPFSFNCTHSLGDPSYIDALSTSCRPNNSHNNVSKPCLGCCAQLCSQHFLMDASI